MILNNIKKLLSRASYVHEVCLREQVKKNHEDNIWGPIHNKCLEYIQKDPSICIE